MELQAELNRLAGTTDLDAQGAANVLAGTTNLDLVGALNAKAGTVGLGFNAAVKAVAAAMGGDSSLDANAALATATSFTPSSLSGLVAWYDAANITGSDGASVSSWPDSASSPHNATQATGTKQPLLKTNIINSKPVVRFDGSNDYLRSTLSLSQPDTIFVVLRSIVGASGIRVILDGATLNSHLVRTVSNFEIYAGGAVVGSVAADTNSHIIAVKFNGASSSIWVDGGTATTGNAGSGGMSALTIGIGGDQANFAGNYDMAEIVIYNSALSTTNMNKVGAYLSSKYAITWSTV